MSINILSYTIIEIPNTLPSLTDITIAAYFLSTLYYLTVIIMPIFINIFLFYIWLLPINYNQHNKYLYYLLLFQAWNGLDVFLIGTVSASLELNQVSQWIINTNFQQVCGTNGLVNNLIGMECFSVKGNILYGTIMILIVVIIQWFTFIYTLKHIKKIHKANL